MRRYRRNSNYSNNGRASSPFGGIPKARLFMALGLVAFALINFLSSATENEITGKKQYVAIKPDQEIAMGLQAAPAMAQEYGGLDKNVVAQNKVDDIGNALVQNSIARTTDWQYDFHLLADAQTVNAFALPGGQIFITRALYDRLQNDQQLAGVLAHEIGHVIARHGAARLAKQQLTGSLTGAVVVASGNNNMGQMSAMVGQMINMKYGREDELESDELGVRFMLEAGYDPAALIDVMKILAESRGGETPPEFASTHPSPENRIQRIKDAIEYYGSRTETR